MIKPIVALAIVSNLLFIAACKDITLDISLGDIAAKFDVFVTDEDASQALFSSTMYAFSPIGQTSDIVIDESTSVTADVAGAPHSPSKYIFKDGGQYSTMYQTEDKLLLTIAERGRRPYAMTNRPNSGDEIIIEFQQANGEILSSNGFVHNIPTVTAPIAGTVIPETQQEITVSWDNLDAEQQNSQINVESYVRCAAYQELGADGGIEDNWDHLAEKGGFSIRAKGSDGSLKLRRSDILMDITPEAGVSRCLAIVQVSSLVQGAINPKFRQAFITRSYFMIHHQARRVVYYIDL